MGRLDNKQRKKLKREEKKLKALKAEQRAGTSKVQAEKMHSGKVMASILIIMAIFGAAAIIVAYS